MAIHLLIFCKFSFALLLREIMFESCLFIIPLFLLQKMNFIRFFGFECSNLDAMSLRGPTIPTSIGTLTDLKHLDLAYNQLESTLPSEIARLTQLTALLLRQNRLTGSLPPLPATLRRFAVYLNRLDGYLPTLPDDMRFCSLYYQNATDTSRGTEANCFRNDTCQKPCNCDERDVDGRRSCLVSTPFVSSFETTTTSSFETTTTNQSIATSTSFQNNNVSTTSTLFATTGSNSSNTTTTTTYPTPYPTYAYYTTTKFIADGVVSCVFLQSYLCQPIRNNVGLCVGQHIVGANDFRHCIWCCDISRGGWRVCCCWCVDVSRSSRRRRRSYKESIDRVGKCTSTMLVVLFGFGVVGCGLILMCM
jgi:hypothetical protein